MGQREAVIPSPRARGTCMHYEDRMRAKGGADEIYQSQIKVPLDLVLHVLDD